MALASDILPPRYRSPERIGAGGMGEIYRATDTTLGRTVAIKVLAEAFAQDGPSRARFTREALAAARLSGDPHTVTIFDVGEWNGRPFIVMEELTGGSLEQRLQRSGRPAPAQALDWLDQAASALDSAHSSGVVHRDVKPGNLLLDGDGALYVADFGVASAAGMTSLTMAGTVLGTAGYLAPEQARGERATAASDRYALAVVAYLLLTGALPATPPAPVREHDASLPGALDEVFARGLARDPGQRPATAARLVAELRGAFTAPTRVATAETAVLKTAPRRSRLPLLLGLLAAAVAGGLAAAIVATRGDGTPAAAPSVSVRTVTAKGRTVQSTRTVQRTVTERPPTTTPAEAPTPDGHTLNDQGYARLQAGDAAGALPLLTEAVQKLAGTGPGDLYEGYANYNAGIALLQLGRCAEAKPYLERARHLEKGRHEPEEALKQVKKCERATKRAARRTAARRTPGTRPT